ncbi:MAG: hypothetical protein J4G18_15920 [Anaerolineae bacterium]|nr:hypothetical protein [Anaerolineae bacterium]
MIDSPIRAINDVVAGFLSCRPSDDKILEYFIPPDLQLRADFLSELHGEGELSAREREQVFEFVRADGFMSLLKAKIKRRQRLGKLPVCV